MSQLMTKPETRRARNRADSRDRALPLTERICLNEGITALTVRQRAQELGVSVGSLYNAFRDLAAIVRVVIELSSQTLADAVHDAVATASAKPRARLIARFRVFR